ncbi:MAG TPA: response regulator, partial [Longimicrobiales bacterium]|nr:response regulator [Longimicrobiales bacterium]
MAQLDTSAGRRSDATDSAAPRPSDAAEPRPSRILVVDDEPLARQMFADLLEAQNFDVVTVARGEEAFGYIGEVDLILLDAMLPGRDGWS